jgi:beta-lactamase regulating signal transducer with metallopeptidase domain
MTEVSLLSAVGAAAIKAAVILAIAGLVNVAWRSASAAARHLVWTLAVSAALAVPAIGTVIARMNAPRIEVPVWSGAIGLPAATLTQFPAAQAPVAEDRSKSETFPAPRPEPVFSSQLTTADLPSVINERTAIESPKEIDWQALIFPLWVAGVILTLFPILIAQIRIRLLARAATLDSGKWNDLIAATPSISRFAGRVRILESDETAMPMTWGVFRPTLLVPSNAERWPHWQRRDILLHELAHVDRRDCLTQLVAQIACAVYWFNPLAWVASHRMRVERELACDDRVINAGARAADYASNLLDVARSLRAPSMTSHTAIAMARPSQLSGRLLAVLDKHRNRRSVNRRIAAGTSFAAIAVVLPLASLTPASAATAVESRMEEPTTSLSQPEVPGVQSSSAAAFPAAASAIVRAIQLPAVGILETSSVPPLKLEAPTTALPLPAPGGLLQQSTVCWDRSDGSTNVSINSDDHNKKRQSYTVRYTRDDCSLELRAEGDFTLRPDLSDVETVGSNGWVRIEEREGRSSRRVEITRGDNGALEHKYWVNGDRAAWDASAREWLASTLLAVERRTAFAADTRVPQLYRSGGLNAVLREISAMPSAYPKSKYYGTLLDMGVNLDSNTLNSIVRQVTTDLASSDYYMSEVLGKFSSQSSADENTWRAFTEAAGRMKSDYYRSQTLKRVLSKGRLSGSTVGLLLRNASTMKSDYYLSDLLKEVAGKYALNSETRQYYVDALRSIESDYYRSELLKSMGTGGDWDAKTTAFVLDAVAGIKSDYYKSESLKSLARANKIDSWSNYFSATSTIESDYYKKETLRAALDRKPLTREIVAGVLNVAQRIKSDSEMADVLGTVARNYNLDEGLRAAYEKAVDAMDSDYYRGAALSALRRSVSR